jgi:hypothetical protein
LEKRIIAYSDTIAGLDEVIALGDLAQQQVEGLRSSLQNRAVFWRGSFYNE